MVEEIAISLRNVSKLYKRYHRPVDRLKEILLPGKPRAEIFWALRDITLEVPKGERVGIIGRNGAGKSTLLQIIAGTLTPTTGEIAVNGRMSALLELGSGFDPEFTGRENIFFSGRLLGLEKEEIESKFDDISAFADIEDFIDQPVKTYSSGMYVRLAFALAVNVNPDILIVDEALSVGDAAFQFKSFRRLEKLMEAGATVILVSHDIGAIKSVCDQILYLQNGTLRAFGNTDEVAEIYFLDIQSQQKLDSLQGQFVKAKKSLSGKKRLALGTDEGKVLDVRFINDSDQSGIFYTGDQILIEVIVEHLSSLQNPSVSLSIEDRRSLPISGKYIKLTKIRSNLEIVRRRVIFRFQAGLIEGIYFLTVRLESRQSDKMFYPVDKQAGVLSFKVLDTEDKDFLGIADLKINSYEEEATNTNSM
ncbi:ABC transporter ATP-binding protein [Nodosilinea sp. P-1105]|uniref:ABC transporter ATP-binding protein n=1 Tax=Nodosilinea sp. P-1105 TaxID=2546229 RepID=UPI00146D4BDC|nr:ABC transporter ATP-binding protein [Nodosilinea sp. P-1105]NMF85927.1 ABC transporter ATP-binding protein [Nodosilinea sp. P-1105]